MGLQPGIPYPLTNLAPDLGPEHAVFLRPPEPDEGRFPRAEATVVRYQGGEAYREHYGVVCEGELLVEANGTPLATLLCSQADLRELAYGFLYTEGIVASLDEVCTCTLDLDGDVPAARFELARPIERPTCPVVTSGFGGRALHAPDSAAPSKLDGAETPASLAPTDVARIQAAARTMRAHATEYAATRGLHCSALFRNGRILACYEDVGRHNTLDKLAGHCLLEDVDASGALLVTTGRVSCEMAGKALRLGVGALASFSGPTDRAVALARGAGLVLVGYVGEASAVVYAAPERETRRGALCLV